MDAFKVATFEFSKDPPSQPPQQPAPPEKKSADFWSGLLPPSNAPIEQNSETSLGRRGRKEVPVLTI